MTEDVKRDRDSALAREARRATGLSQRAFSRVLGVSHVTVANWETGARRPSAIARAALRIVAAFPGTSSTALFREDTPKEGQKAPPAPMPPVIELVREQVGEALRERTTRGSVPIAEVEQVVVESVRKALSSALLELEARGRIALEPGVAGTSGAGVVHPTRGLVREVRILR